MHDSCEYGTIKEFSDESMLSKAGCSDEMIELIFREKKHELHGKLEESLSLKFISSFEDNDYKSVECPITS